MKKFAKRLKKLLENEAIEDIIIFGSISKGRITSKDIDVAVIMNDRNKDSSIEIKKNIKNFFPNADIEIISIKDIYNPVFLTLIKEGFSVKRNDYLHNLHHIRPFKLYKYSLKQLTASKKVMFERGIKSIKELNRLSNSVVLVPIEHTAEFEDFLKQWNLDIDAEQYELVPLLRKEEF